jgi:O-antigen/teichoic acid export membrane protein
MDNIGKNIWFTSIHRFVPAVTSFIFWFLAAKIAGAEILGMVSTFNSLLILMSTFLMFDIFLGMKRYLGISQSTENYSQSKEIFVSSIIFVTSSLAFFLIFLYLPYFNILDSIGIDRDYSWLFLILLPIYCFYVLFSETLISLLKSRSLLNPVLFGSILRFPLLFLFIFIVYFPSIGTITAYFSMFFVSTICYGYELHKYLKKYHFNWSESFKYVRVIFSSGFTSWLPHIINVLGSQLSLITVFAVAGASEAGKFYLPLAIFTLTFFIVNSITRVSHPLIAGMPSEKQNSFVIYSIKMAFLITIPISVGFLLFPTDFLALIGKEYESATTALTIFMISIPFSIISEIIYYYVYAKGDHKLLLVLGLSGNLPRVFLYFLLVPVIGLNGSAIAYVIGTGIQFIISIKLAKPYSLKFEYKVYVIVTLIPILIGSPFVIFDVNFVLSIVAIIIITIIFYIKLGYITKKEMHLLTYSVFSNNQADRVYKLVTRIYDHIKKED